MRVYIYRDIARDSSNDRAYRIEVRAFDDRFKPKGFISISESWEHEPDVDGMPPSFALDLIEARLKSYFIHTGRDVGLQTIATLRSMIAEVDDSWARAEIASLTDRAKDLELYLIAEPEVAS